MHTEYFNSKNERVPSVTEVLKVLSKPNLIEWANYMGFRKRLVKDILAETAEFGTEVHRLIECDFRKHVAVQTGTDKFIDDTQTSLRKFKIWAKEMQIDIVDMEKSLHGEKFGGTLDIIGTVMKNTTALIDIKTSKKIYHMQFIQLAGYLCLLEDVDNYIPDICMIVSVRPDKVQYIQAKVEDMEKYKKLFKQLVDVYNGYKDICDDWGVELG